MNNKKSKMLMNGILLAAITTIGIGSYQLMMSPDYEDVVIPKERVTEDSEESIDESASMVDADTKNVIASLDEKNSSMLKDGTEGILKEKNSGEVQEDSETLLNILQAQEATNSGDENTEYLEDAEAEYEEVASLDIFSEEAGDVLSDGTTSYEMTSEETASAETSSTAVGVPVPAAAYLDFSEDTMMEWPVHGNIVLDYDMEQTTYFPTLDQYRLNPAIAVQAVEGTPVNASVDGVVYKIENDPRTGTTVTMELGNGYQAIYGQLKDLTIYEGETIERGSTIGYIAAPTKYYSEEGSNLYYAMKKNGEPIDPVLYLP